MSVNGAGAGALSSVRGDKVDKRISHKQKHKFQVKATNRVLYHVAHMHAICLYLTLNLQLQASSSRNMNVLELFSQNDPWC